MQQVTDMEFTLNHQPFTVSLATDEAFSATNLISAASSAVTHLNSRTNILPLRKRGGGVGEQYHHSFFCCNSS